jgi:hypothetical protein
MEWLELTEEAVRALPKDASRAVKGPRRRTSLSPHRSIDLGQTEVGGTGHGMRQIETALDLALLQSTPYRRAPDMSRRPPSTAFLKLRSFPRLALVRSNVARDPASICEEGAAKPRNR